ncbi:MAG: class I SAM-dependent methyltransferase [Verrucomicrobiota bacterium]
MSFDTLAPHYDWMEFFLAGQKLQRCRVAFLDQIVCPRNILILGEGHGRGVVECVRRFPNVPITCVEASASMIAIARRRLRRNFGETRQVNFVHADALSWKPPEAAFDLIIAQFFFDCFRREQLAQLIPAVAARAMPRTDWLIADFQNAPCGFRRVRSRLILAMMYIFFRAVARLSARQLTPPDEWLKQSGFTLHRREEGEWNLLRSDWWKKNEPSPGSVF